MMKILSSYSKATWVFICFLLLMLIAANTYLSRMTIEEFSVLQRDIARHSEIIDVVDAIHIDLLKAESGQRGFLLSKNESYLKHFEYSIDSAEKLLYKLSAFDFKSEQQQNSAELLARAVQGKIDQLKKSLNVALDGEFTDAHALTERGSAEIPYDDILKQFKQLKQAQENRHQQLSQRLLTATQESERNLNISFLTSLFMVIGVFFLARLNIQNQHARQADMQTQNEKLQEAVAKRTKELSLFSDELSRSNRELEDFAFVASHDLQEPLRKIMAFGDRLNTQSDNLSDKQRDYLQRMRGAAKRMSKLISDLLEFSRVATRGRPFQLTKLNDIVKNCEEDLSVLIEETGAQLHIAELPTITADPTQMQQLLFNLLANAIKFSQNQSHPKVSVTVAPCQQPSEIEVEGLSDWIRLDVKDNGIGFEQEYADKIFVPFQRLHGRDSYKGTGIGLAICRRIVERHNGIIMAQGNPGKGATITAILPTNNHLSNIKQQ